MDNTCNLLFHSLVGKELVICTLRALDIFLEEGSNYTSLSINGTDLIDFINDKNFFSRAHAISSSIRSFKAIRQLWQMKMANFIST